MNLSVELPPLAAIRAEKSGEPSEKGEPTLIIRTTSTFRWIWNDEGSGSKADVTVYRPVPQENFFVLGDYAQGNYAQPAGVALTVEEINSDPVNPLLKPPEGYQWVWDDKRSGGKYDGSIWYPKPPAGYLTLGYVAALGYNPPNIPELRCVRKDLCRQSEIGAVIWTDRGSGARADVTLYQILRSVNAFYAQPNFNPPVGTVWVLAGADAAG